MKKWQRTATFYPLLIALMVAIAACGYVFTANRDSNSDNSSGAENGYRSYSASALDYDGDGDKDIYVANYFRGNYLLRNNGDGTFTDVAKSAGVADEGQGSRTETADYDLDGDPDIFVVNNLGDISRLYRNEGDGTFKDMTANAGLDIARFSAGVDAGWADYDRDGDPDLYITHNGHMLHSSGLTNILYRNNGDGTFTDVTVEANMENYSPAVSAEWGDYNGDGYPDLYITNFTNADFPPPENATNTLYKNNGDGTFTDVTVESGAYDGLGGYDAEWVDFDNDGRTDLYMANVLDILKSSTDKLYRNNGDGTFTDVAQSAGVDGSVSTVDALWSDMDLDGDQDLLLSFIESEPYHVLYKNNGNGTFTDVTESSGIDTSIPGQWSIAEDFDGDGYPDIFMPRVGYENALYKNLSKHFSSIRFSSSYKALPATESGKASSAPAARTPQRQAVDTLFSGIKGATVLNSRTIDVTWEGGTSEDVFNIYVSATSGGQAENPTAVSDAGKTGWIVEGLDPGTIYHVSVFRVSGGTVYTNDAEVVIGTPATSYQEDVRPVLTYGCVMIACHAPSSAAQGLILGEDVKVSELADNLSVENPGMDLVEPFDSQNSYIYRKVEGTHLNSGGTGARMPYQRVDYLRDWEITVIKEWIDSGAKENSVSIYCDSETYALSANVTCNANVIKGSEATADFYLTLSLPDGGTSYLSPSGSGATLSSTATPFYGSWQVTGLLSSELFQISASTLGQAGAYTLNAWIVSEGGSRDDNSAWISNKSFFGITLE